MAELHEQAIDVFRNLGLDGIDDLVPPGAKVRDERAVELDHRQRKRHAGENGAYGRDAPSARD